MLSFRLFAITAATATLGLVGCAQTPASHGAYPPDAPPAADMPMSMDGTAAPLARMDEQMKAMQAMHDKMMQAKTPEQRSALMAEHMKVMQDSMAMMGGMMGKGSMGGDMAAPDPMRGKHRQMMQSMMQMMMDRMPQAPGKPGPSTP